MKSPLNLKIHNYLWYNRKYRNCDTQFTNSVSFNNLTASMRYPYANGSTKRKYENLLGFAISRRCPAYSDASVILFTSFCPVSIAAAR